MAWEGAFGVVPPECDGCVVSTEFPVFEVNEDLVLHEVLDIYFRTPSVWQDVAGASTGTNVRRRRLNPESFLNYAIPLPSRATQLKVRKVTAEVDAMKRLQAEDLRRTRRPPPRHPRPRVQGRTVNVEWVTDQPQPNFANENFHACCVAT